jgi:hypothetical protein
MFRPDRSDAAFAKAVHAFYAIDRKEAARRPVLDSEPPPSFFLVGAPRCGTTSLSRALKDHPAISFSKPKETQYFHLAPADMADAELRATYLAVHHPELSGDHRALGDGSVSYLYSPDCVRRALRFDPRARFIATVRNPLELVPSHHARMLFTLEEDVADFERAWDLAGERAQGRRIPRRCRDARVLQYPEVGRLGHHLERLFEVAGRERCLVLVHDDLRRDLGPAYRQVLAFIGVADDGRTRFLKRAENRRFKSTFLQQFVMNPPSWTLPLIRYGNSATIKRLKSMRRRIEKANTFTAERPSLSAAMRERLAQHYAADIAKLGRLIDRDLGHWLDVREGPVRKARFE